VQAQGQGVIDFHHTVEPMGREREREREIKRQTGTDAPSLYLPHRESEDFPPGIRWSVVDRCLIWALNKPSRKTDKLLRY